MDRYTIRPVAYVRSDYNEKFGIPKQCGLVNELEQAVVFEPEFCNVDCLREIEDFEYLWIIWGFSRSSRDTETGDPVWSPTVRPPRLGGNRRVGVWASRSPYRPNALGLSSVKLLRVELNGRAVRSDEMSGPAGGELAIIVSGGDMMNGTPVYDIKPYLPYSDIHTDATDGYSKGKSDPSLDVVFPDELISRIPEEKRAGLIRILSLDPRDAYEKKPGHTYGFSFAEWDIRFRVDGQILTVTEVI